MYVQLHSVKIKNAIPLVSEDANYLRSGRAVSRSQAG
jgi:hypothetical protein